MKLRLLSAADLDQVIPMGDAIEVMKEAFADLSLGRSRAPQRLAIEVSEAAGTALIKPAITQTALGAKLVSVFPGNRQRGLPVTSGLMVLLDLGTGIPIGLCDGTFLTALRTGAATGAATDLLARRESRVAALIGCGGQAAAQVQALACVRELEEIRVYARTQARVEAFVARLQVQVPMRLRAAESAADAVDGADIVCAVTTSLAPVFDGRSLASGTHVNGLGSFTPEMQELDRETVLGARVFVDSRATAETEAGELIAAMRAGQTSPAEWTEIGEVAAGVRPGRLASAEITLSKSVGVAIQDVAAAAVAFERATEAGIGQMVEL